MDTAIAKLVDKVLEHGLAGAIIIALMVALIFLWRELRACRLTHNEIIRVAERSTVALNTLTAWGEARNAINAELKEAIVMQTTAIQSLRDYIAQLSDLDRERYEQLQREIARRT